MTNRILRSRKLRYALLAAFDGKCAICGQPLPDNWHADHIVPFSLSHRTNVHEMQPLCPRCNLEKGTKMYRRHQQELREIARGLTRNDDITDLLIKVTPGGGKSALPMILDAEVATRLNYKICWVVPRDNLRTQGESDFVKSNMRHIFGHRGKIRAAGNDWNPTHGERGYITTYQAISTNSQIHQDEFERSARNGQPYILFLDECHHVPYRGAVGDEAAFFAAIEPLINLAILRVFASGTFERGDKQHIAFIPYTRLVGSDVIDFGQRDHWRSIQYSRADALGEQAIVPLHMQVMDGNAVWIDEATGEVRQVPSIATPARRDEPNVLKTVLQTQYAYDLIDRCVNAWSEHRDVVYPHAKMLVIAPTINVANEYCAHLVRQGYRASIATSDDTPAAQKNIKHFKGGRGVTANHELDILVTVGMAYEGLDVPQITHIACLTNIRSRPWIEQAICRANRTSEGKTHGFIFYPDDRRMRELMAGIQQEQAAVVPIAELRQPPALEGTGGGTRGPRLGIDPIDSAVTRARGQGLEDGLQIDYDEFAAITEAMVEVRIRGVSPVQMVQWRQAMARRDGAVGAPAHVEAQADPLVFAPREEELLLRRTIVQLVNRIGRGDGTVIAEINRTKSALFGPVAHANVEVLRLMIRWINENYSDELAGGTIE